MAKVPFTLRIEEELLKKIKRDALDHEISISSEIELRIIGSMAIQEYQKYLETQDDLEVIKDELYSQLLHKSSQLKVKYKLW